MATLNIGPSTSGAAQLTNIINDIDNGVVELQIVEATTTSYRVRAGTFDAVFTGSGFVYEAGNDLEGGSLSTLVFSFSGVPMLQYGGLTATVAELIAAFERGGTPEALAAVLNRGDDQIVVTAPGIAVNLFGSLGNDTIDAGVAGSVVFYEGPGNDSYTVRGNTSYTFQQTAFFSNQGVIVLNESESGIDSLSIESTATLPAYIENLTLLGAGHIDGTGNGSSNTITGNSGNNVLSGLGGNDTLIGAEGNDALNGGSGIDSLDGGGGDDTYIIDDADVITDASGNDTVQSSVSFVMPGTIEILVLTGTSAINGTGNSSNNTITGNSNANVLEGGSGDDALNGGNGNDTLNGGAGTNTLNGGDGDDTYVITDANDTISDTSGTDTVQISLTYTLVAALENLILTGTVAINGSGNASGNNISGNAANNTLEGGSGADTLQGNAGDDTLEGEEGID
jgi:Ca2+-binding RTX toxin-like protein